MALDMNIKKMDFKTEDNILRLLECPVCYLYITPPIKQCVRGHLVCSRCFPLVIRCPLCRGPKSRMTASILESVLTVLTLPCRYASHGCVFTTTGKSMRQHEDYCIYRKWYCAFEYSSGCSWHGPKTELYQHMRNNHTFLVAVQREKTFYATAITYPLHIVAFCVYDMIFRAVWCFTTCGNVLFSVNIFDGERCRNQKFSFRLTISLTCEVFTRELPCVHVPEGVVLERQNSVMVRYGFLRDNCSYGGPFSYRVEIIREEPTQKMTDGDELDDVDIIST